MRNVGIFRFHYRLLFLQICHFLLFVTLIESDPSSSSVEINCNFEYGFCAWNNTDDILLWRRQKGSPNTLVDGPGIDHTLTTGYYVYIQSPMNVSGTPYVVLESPLLPPSHNGSCFSFAYHMFGIRVETLEVILERHTKGAQFSETIWSRCSSQGNQWNEANVTVRSNTAYKIIMRAYVRYPQYVWSIALDDTFLRNGECMLPINWCDFEDGFCDWSSKNNTWHLSTPKHSSQFPESDHTTGSSLGHFAYAEPLKLPDKPQAIMLSQEQQPTKSSCLELWYIILDDESSLDIQIMYLNTQNTTTLSLRRVYSIDKRAWNPVKIPINSDYPYQIFLKATFGFKEILVDDVIIHSRSCEVPDYCTFQYGFCNWQNSINADVKWLRSIGGLPTNKFSAPETDATYTDSGYFIFFPVKRLPVNTKAVLMSEPLLYGPFICLNFQYSINQTKPDVGELQVILHLLDDFEMILLKTSEKTGPSTWAEASVSIACTKAVSILKFKISLQAIAGEGEGYIAVDDLQITNRSCQGVPDLKPPDAVLPSCYVVYATHPTTGSTYSTPVSSMSTANSTDSLSTNNANSSSSINISLPVQPNLTTTELIFSSTDGDFTSTITTSTDAVITTVETTETWKTTVSSCQNNTGENCELMNKKDNSLLTGEEALMYVTIPVVALLLGIIVIISIAFYKHRKKTAWLSYIGMVKGPYRRKMLIPYDRNSMRDDPVDVTDSAMEAAQHRGLFIPNGNCLFDNRNCITLESSNELNDEMAPETNA